MGPIPRRAWWLLAATAATALAVALWCKQPTAAWRAEHALPRGRRPGVLLVTLDSVRADRLGFTGHSPARTPRLDALAREGVAFEAAYVQAPLCVPSHATILTGLTPLAHGIRDDHGDTLGKDVTTLAEAFRAAGYRTGAFVSSALLDRRTGLDRGFDVYHDDLGEPGKKSLGREGPAKASDTVQEALAWVVEPDPHPFFLWTHLDPEEGPYDAGIAALDAQVGRLLDGVRQARPGILVGLLADHGEALGDHGEPRHGFFAYSATTHVPFVLSMPGHLPGGVRIPAVVRAMDLAPTLLDLIGLPVPPRIQGSSLVLLIVGRTREGPGPAPIEDLALQTRYGMGPLAALRSGPYLYVRAPRPELYDVAQDPDEKDDASTRLPRVAAQLERELARWIPDTPSRLAQPDPKDGLDLLRRYQAALDADMRGDLARAEAGYRSLLSEAPGFVLARRRLSECLLRGKRPSEAAHLLQELLDHHQADESTYLNLALTAYRDKKGSEALAWLRRGAQALPRSAALRHRMGRLLLELKRYPEAEAELRQALVLEPLLLDSQLALGDALEAQGRVDESQAAYRRILHLAPTSSEARQASERLVKRP